MTENKKDELKYRIVKLLLPLPQTCLSADRGTKTQRRVSCLTHPFCKVAYEKIPLPLPGGDADSVY